MIEVVGDLWDYHQRGFWAGITTNGVVKRSGELVMGAGIAKQARDRYPGLAAQLGHQVQLMGNVPLYLFEYNVFTFPTKDHWKTPSDLSLINRSARFLQTWLDTWRSPVQVCLPRPGCQNGRLTWAQVRPMIELLDDRVYVITNEAV